MNTNNFIFRKEWLDSIACLPIEQQDMIIAEIIRYNFGLKLEHSNDCIIQAIVNMTKDNKNIQKTKSHQIDVEELKKHRGIYGIFVDDELVYIGKTFESFDSRLKDHGKMIKSGEGGEKYKYLYNEKKMGKEVYARPLIDIDNLYTNSKQNITNNELECMEYALITYLQPKLNISGVIKKYGFSNK